MSEKTELPAFGLIDPNHVLLPCDVLVPPATRIGKGCTLETLLVALDKRARATGEDYESLTRFKDIAAARRILEAGPDWAITSDEMVEKGLQSRPFDAPYDMRAALGFSVDQTSQNFMRFALTAVADALRPMLGTGGPRWRHKKRGTTYVELHRAELQHADPRFDCLPLVVYQCEKDGRVWVRPVDEFEDGRFEPAPPTQERPR